MNQNKPLQIAIDGPVAAGKSTVAKILSERLGILYVDTGAMYRAVALKAQQSCIQWVDEASIVALLSTLNLELDKPNEAENDGRLLTVLLDGQDISNQIRTPLLGEGASIVSTYRAVREVLVHLQQNIAADESVVMEGRDICSVVLPEADIKIYMDASVEVRVDRKMQYLLSRGINQPRNQVKADLEKRDKREMTRTVTPLKPAPDAWILDTTDLGIEGVVEAIIAEVEQCS